VPIITYLIFSQPISGKYSVRMIEETAVIIVFDIPFLMNFPTIQLIIKYNKIINTSRKYQFPEDMLKYSIIFFHYLQLVLFKDTSKLLTT
jgi:hypothetical protein